MITEDYVSYELAKLLKEKGFKGVCDYAYSNKGHYFEIDRSNYDEIYCLRPTHQMAMKWLREVHKICIVIEPVVSDDDGDAGCLWSYRISKYTESIGVSPSVFTTYVETTEEAIKYSLENLI